MAIMSVQDYIAKLKDLPTDISHIPLPPLSTPTEQAELSHALKDLEIEGTREGRHTVLLAASLLPPDSHWENAAWIWAAEDGPEVLDTDEKVHPSNPNKDTLKGKGEGGDTERVLDWIATGLSDGKFDWEWYVQEGVRRHSWGDRCKRVLVKWGVADLDTVLGHLARLYIDASSRIDVTIVLLYLVVEEEYEPGSSPNSTVMYRMIEHPILALLLKSLTFDTGNALFPLTLKLFLAIIPFGPQLFTPHVPELMVITGRAISWQDRKFADEEESADTVGVTRTFPPAPPPSEESDAEGAKQAEDNGDGDESRANVAAQANKPPISKQAWHVAKSRNEPPTTLTPIESSAKIVRLWLVGMYGAWPSNVLAFIRDPVSYLAGKHMSSPYVAPWSDVYPDGFLAKRSGPLLKNFSLHPMLIYFTSAAELQDQKRWERNDPSEWLARAQTIAHMELTAGGRFKLLSGYPEMGLAFSSPETEKEKDASRDKGATEILSPSAGVVLEPEEKGGAENTIFNIPSGQATPSGSLMLSMGGSVSGSGNGNEDVRKLRRENEALRLEAMLTDRVRKQFLYHIARLHSYTIRFTTEESEMNRMLNRLKDETKRYEQLQSSLEAQKEQASAAQQKHTKWLAHMRDKHDKLRDERRQTQEQIKEVRDQLTDSEKRVKRLGDELAVVKNERFKLQNQLTEVAPKIRHIEDYEVRMKQMTDMLRLWDRDVERVKMAESTVEELRARMYQMEQIMRAVEKEKSEQTEIVRRLRTTVALKEESRPSSPHPRRPRQPDASYFIHVSDEAKARAEKVEKENRILRDEVERLREELEEQMRIAGKNGSGGGGGEGKEEKDRAFIWGGQS